MSKTGLEPIEPHIHSIRGRRVILDSDLAKIYGVTTARLNQQVRRNLKKFPADFLFQLLTFHEPMDTLPQMGKCIH